MKKMEVQPGFCVWTGLKRLHTDSRSKRKEHHQDTKTPRKAKASANSVLGGLGVLVVGIHFLAS
jgi:hypothetical protein